LGMVGRDPLYFRPGKSTWKTAQGFSEVATECRVVTCPLAARQTG
jgi:hypothetical protein